MTEGMKRFFYEVKTGYKRQETSGGLGDKSVKNKRWRKKKCTIEQIGDREGDNDYLNTEKYGNKTPSLAALKTNGFCRKWCSRLSACP